MNRTNAYSLFVAGALLMTLVVTGLAQNGGPRGETVDVRFADAPELPPADVKTAAIVAAAEAFLDTLAADQRRSVVYAFDDNQQRARWSNLPIGNVERGGVFRGDMSEEQTVALDALLAEVLSAAGLRNAQLQMAADDALLQRGGRQDFGGAFYYVAFLGEPALDQPWMLQFGGHHLALNVTFAGPQASFSPMLTGGQPITFEYQGAVVNITEQETSAAQALLDSLDADQKDSAVRGRAPIQFLLGPGAHGTTVAPEGVRGADLSAAQKDLLLAVVEARIGHFNARDAEAKMAAVRAAIDDMYFGWWGPEDSAAAAYFRITAPGLVMEYAPQGGSDPAEHVHNMYRDPTNDYGAAWLEVVE